MNWIFWFIEQKKIEFIRLLPSIRISIGFSEKDRIFIIVILVIAQNYYNNQKLLSNFESLAYSAVRNL